MAETNEEQLSVRGKGKGRDDDSTNKQKDILSQREGNKDDNDNNNNNGKSKQKKKRNKKYKHDPNGSSGVAQGMTEEDAKERREAVWKDRSTKDQTRIQTYLEGSNAHHSKERLDLLQEDDKNTSLKNLNGYQQRALQKRQKRPNKKVQASLDRHEVRNLEAAAAAADAEVVVHTETPGMVEAEHDMERTTSLTQVQLKNEHLSEQTAQHIYDLSLNDSYGMQYDRSGRSAILYSSRGHVALMDCQQRSLQKEFYVNERIRDATFLHNQTMFAAAQRNHAYIYDDSGAEIHRLNDHTGPEVLDFLPYHWLLVSLGRGGVLRYQDTSTGQLVSTHKTKLGAPLCMRQNPSNAVMHVGHKNGVVTLWAPSSHQYLAKMLCHKGAPIVSVAVDPTGNYMATGGADRRVKIWDMRNFQKCLTYHTVGAGAPVSLDFSQRGILGIGHGCRSTFWAPSVVKTKLQDPYMFHMMPGCGPVGTLRFRPFEDVCGIGHAKGISSIVIPGSGEPNLDSMEHNTNPYQEKQQQREAEVRSLLDKLQPDMISLDPDVVASVEASNRHIRQERLQDLEDAANERDPVKRKQKAKKRGRSKIQTQLRRKDAVYEGDTTKKLRTTIKEDKAEADAERKNKAKSALKEAAPSALKRFFS